MSPTTQEPAAGAGVKPLAVVYRAGERIVAAAETGSCLFLVQSGQVRLSCPAEGSGPARELGLLGKGDFFGETTLFERRPFGVDAEAVVDSEVIEIGGGTFQRMLQNSADLGLRVIRRLAQRLAELETRVSAPAPPAAGVSPRLPPAAAAVQGRLASEDGKTTFNLAGGEMLLGRYDPVTEIQPEVDLTDLDVKRSVSRRHARLNFRDGEWLLSEETGALNGTFLNGVRLGPGRFQALREGDLIALGMVRLVYHGD